MEVYKIVLSLVLMGLCLILGIALYIRKPQEWLNRLFFGAFASYAVFFLFDALMGIFYFDSALANLWRDISSLASIAGHSFVFLSGIYIWKGKEILRNPRFTVSFILISTVIGIIGQLNDWVIVDLGTQSYTLEHNPIGLVCAYLYGAAIIAVSIVIYFRIYASSEDPTVKTRLKQIVVGLLVVIIGQVIQTIFLASLAIDVYYALVFPEAIVYTMWAVGIIFATRALWK